MLARAAASPRLSTRVYHRSASTAGRYQPAHRHVERISPRADSATVVRTRRTSLLRGASVAARQLDSCADRSLYRERPRNCASQLLPVCNLDLRAGSVRASEKTD